MKKRKLWKLEMCVNAVIIYRLDRNIGRWGLIFREAKFGNGIIVPYYIKSEYSSIPLPKYIFNEAKEILDGNFPQGYTV